MTRAKRLKIEEPQTQAQAEDDGKTLLHVRVALRTRLPEVPHILQLVSSFLHSRSVPQLCRLNLLQILQQVLAQQEQEPSDSIQKFPGFRRWQFTEAMEAAVSHGNLVVVQLLVHYFSECRVPIQITNHAAADNQLGILKWIFGNCSQVSKSYQCVASALRNGHLEAAKFLYSVVKKTNVNWVSAAAESGDVEAVKWAYTKTRSVCEEENLMKAIAVAMGKGHVEVLEWLLTRVDDKVHLGDASIQGHFHVVEWMLSNHPAKCRGSSAAMKHAAAQGRLDIVRMIHDSAVLKAAKDTELFTNELMDGPAVNGHLNVLQWLHEKGYNKCSVKAMDGAAGNGHFKVVKWLHENRGEGCTTAAVDNAARNGFLTLVKWLLENRHDGCSVAAMDLAATEGHLAVVQWLAEYSSCGCTTAAMDGAAGNGHLDVVQWLHANWNEGCTAQAMHCAAENGHLETVKWLHANRDEGCTLDTMDGAALNGHLDVVRWLRHNRTEGSRNALRGALKARHFAVALFIYMACYNTAIMELLVGLESKVAWQFFDWLLTRRSRAVASALLVQFRATPSWERLRSIQ